MKLVSFFALFVFGLPSLNAAPLVTFESSVNQVSMIELFTSEGCSSCPPADEWMGSLKKEPGLWKEFIPLQFHVDYWDYLGWKDKFALKRYTIRQRQYANQWRASSVYTPGFVLNGSEWRDWGGKIPGLSSFKPGRLTVKGISQGEYLIEFDPSDPTVKTWEAHVAVLGMDLGSDVKAGENRGRRLVHDFVVLGVRGGLLNPSSSRFTAIIRSGLDTTLRPDKTALVVWITKADQLMPVQVAGGYLP